MLAGLKLSLKAIICLINSGYFASQPTIYGRPNTSLSDTQFTQHLQYYPAAALARANQPAAKIQRR